eukprot:275322_1
MFIAWSVFASFGIMASAHRFVFAGKKAGTWFMVHRIVQCLVIILDLAGFGIAIYFTEDSGNPHFDIPHKIGGLVVTIIAIFQPLNALIRPHPANAGEKKPTNRLIWEIVHKAFGYLGWLGAQFVIYSGIQQLNVDDKDMYHLIHYAWFGLMVLILLIVSCFCIKREKVVFR